MIETMRVFAACACAVLGLSACQSGGSAMASRSPAGQTIAFETIEGPPSQVRADLADELVSAASSRKVEMTGLSDGARYRIRGYLSTETGEDGVTQLAFVWDLFDAEKKRASRVAGSSPIRIAAADPWQGLDRATLRRLAERSMDEIALFLASRNDPAPAG